MRFWLIIFKQRKVKFIKIEFYSEEILTKFFYIKWEK